MPGVEQNGEAFAVDWQLPDPLAVEDGRPVQNGRERIVALGTPVDDIHLQAEHVEITGDTLHFNTGGRRFAVRCAGKPPRWGEKGNAATDLAPFAAVPGARVVSGGGLAHSTEQLAKYRDENRLTFAIHAIDTTKSSRRLTVELSAMDVQLTSLDLAPVARNVILTNGHVPPERMALRSLALPPASLDTQAGVLDLLLGPDTVALLINSPKPPEVAAHAVTRAKANGVRVFTVLVPSLPIAFRLERLFSPVEVSICNLAEFFEIPSALGIPCPIDEKPASVAGVVRAMSEVFRRRPCGDLVVTMGELGCVVGDATTGVICHVGLASCAREQVRVSLRPEKVNGRGDRFLAVFAAEHLLFKFPPTERSRALHAARRASLEVVRSFSTRLHPDQNWFNVRIFPERFGR